MFFEDEKENTRDIETLDELSSGIDDDKSITWDDLLNDDAGLDLSSVKKTDSSQYEDFSDIDISDSDFELQDNDAAIINSSGRSNEVSDMDFGDTEPSRDAFDVFGGDVNDADDDIDLNLLSSDDASTSPTVTYDDDDDIGYGIETDKPVSNSKTRGGVKTQKRPAPRRIQPQSHAPENDASDDSDDDVYYFESGKAKKGFNPLPVIIGIVLACLIAAGSVYWFMGNNNLVSKSDFDSLKNSDSPDATLDQGVTNTDLGGVDSQAVADANMNAAAKAKAEADSRKMVILSVQNAGRMNPFVPAKGYDTVAVSESSSYEILNPPESFGDEAVSQEAARLMKITVSGILYDNVKPSAIINVAGSDYFVQTGDKIDDFQVVDINPNYVVIKYGRNMYKAQVGENFANKVEGMASRQSGRFAGARQYTSVSEVQVKIKDDGSNNN